MSCIRTFFETEDSVPLDQAIFSATEDFIYAVRGQFIFKFSTDGTKIKEFRYVDDVIYSEASIVEVGSFLYVGVWRPVYFQNAGTRVNMDIFAVDPALTNSTALGLNLTGALNGFCNLITDGTSIYGLSGYSRNSPAVRIFKVDPTNIASYVDRNAQANRNDPINDLVYDSVNDVIWHAEDNGPEIDAYSADIASLFPLPRSIITPTPALPLYGVTVTPSSQVYGVTKGPNLLKLDGVAACATLPANFTQVPATTLNLLPVGAQPIRIKYNPYDGLIYVPNWSDDTVSIIDPGTDTAVDVVSGFNSPFDVVFTPTKKFAVQLSGTGLQEITT